MRTLSLRSIALVSVSVTSLLVACGGATEGVVVGDDSGTGPDAVLGPDAGHTTDAPKGVDAPYTGDVYAPPPFDGGSFDDVSSDDAGDDSGADDASDASVDATPDVGKKDASAADTGTPQDSAVHDSATGEDVTNPPGCPTSPPSGACTGSVAMTDCAYPGETCTCSFGVPISTSETWQCTQLAAGCPATRPKVGESCTVGAGVDCAYATCDATYDCENGKWKRVPTLCPG